MGGLFEGLEIFNGSESGVRGCCFGMEERGWGVRGFRIMLEERV